MIDLSKMTDEELNERLSFIRDKLVKASSVNANNQIVDQFYNMITAIENEQSERSFHEKYTDPVIINSDETKDLPTPQKKFNKGNIKKINIRKI